MAAYWTLMMHEVATFVAVWFHPDGKVWNGTDWEEYLVGNIATYDATVGTQLGGTFLQKYLIPSAANFGAGLRGIVVAKRVGVDLVEGELGADAYGQVQWFQYDGSDMVSPAELVSAWADGGRLDLLLDAIKAQTDSLPGAVPKNVALSNFAFLMIDSVDKVSPKTGLTVTVQISKDGGAFAGSSNSATELASGVYLVDLIQAEMNADVVILKLTAPGADQRILIIYTSA